MNYARDEEAHERNEGVQRVLSDARKRYVQAREEYLRLMGWTPVTVVLPSRDNGGERAIRPDVRMWVRQRELDQVGGISRTVSTRIALGEQEEIDGEL